MPKSNLHPELRFKGWLIKTFTPSTTPKSAKFIYNLTTKMRGRHSGDLRYEQVYIPRADGTELRVCVYSALAPKENVPGLLWLHGGGYAVGAPEQDEKAYIKRFIDASGCVVVAPDYTKSVVAPYPAALDDAYAALLWLRDNGARYGARNDQIFVGGNSAGGGLAAAVSLYARDKGEAPIAFQMPLFPMLDDRPTPSNTGNKAPLWSSESNDAAWKMYLGQMYRTEKVPIYAAPARASDYSGLPPACTFVGSVEAFHDETVAYMENLKASGVPTHFRVFDGGFHNFDMVCAKSSIAREAQNFLMDTFMYAVRNYTNKG
jgi:acetyl esterase/lipase